jgi:hypothetical protein
MKSKVVNKVTRAAQLIPYWGKVCCYETNSLYFGADSIHFGSHHYALPGFHPQRVYAHVSDPIFSTPEKTALHLLVSASGNKPSVVVHHDTLWKKRALLYGFREASLEEKLAIRFRVERQEAVFSAIFKDKIMEALIPGDWNKESHELYVNSPKQLVPYVGHVCCYKAQSSYYYGSCAFPGLDPQRTYVYILRPKHHLVDEFQLAILQQPTTEPRSVLVDSQLLLTHEVHTRGLCDFRAAQPQERAIISQLLSQGAACFQSTETVPLSHVLDYFKSLLNYPL